MSEPNPVGDQMPWRGVLGVNSWLLSWRNKWSSWSLSIRIAMATLVVTSIGVCVSVLAYVTTLVLHTDGQDAEVRTDQRDLRTPNGASSHAMVDDAMDEGAAPGACLNSVEDISSVVACDTAHFGEIIGAGDACSIEAATRYMGGNPDVDVLDRGVSVSMVDDVCVLSVEGQQVAVSFAGALDLNDGVALRECLNGRTAEFVPCSNDHTGEVVARVSSDSTGSLDCSQQATTYMDRSPASVFKELTVEQINTDSARRCMVSVRADNRWLETSLRALGNRSPETRPIN
ncbi:MULTISPECIES: hypothetical protein [Kocuria]|uniref:Uncharacterized protein n=1 Tax=Kocuria subflava TaxID=1736139 RepID=A0A846TNI4_9MICC|nr:MULTISPECIES: hypothetical protein [Kocuria]NKE10768.1 hypothetical protein [Kocuria subflava]